MFWRRSISQRTEPLWSTVIERLRVASSAETGPGRARAALVFALARSGDVPGAKAEVERLVAMPKAHPLLPLLRAFADRTKPAAIVDAGAAVATETRDAGKGSKHAAGAGGGIPSDSRELVTQGERARAKGDYERARAHSSPLRSIASPNDSEALAGLAAIAYAQHDLSGARASYKRVLAINPNYMPAVVGLADVEWDSGDKATATRMYEGHRRPVPGGRLSGAREAARRGRRLMRQALVAAAVRARIGHGPSCM